MVSLSNSITLGGFYQFFECMRICQMVKNCNVVFFRLSSSWSETDSTLRLALGWSKDLSSCNSYFTLRKCNVNLFSAWYNWTLWDTCKISGGTVCDHTTICLKKKNALGNEIFSSSVVLAVACRMMYCIWWGCLLSVSKQERATLPKILTSHIGSTKKL